MAVNETCSPKRPLTAKSWVTVKFTTWPCVVMGTLSE